MTDHRLQTFAETVFLDGGTLDIGIIRDTALRGTRRRQQVRRGAQRRRRLVNARWAPPRLDLRMFAEALSWSGEVVSRENVLLRTLRFESRAGAMDGCE